MTKNNLKIVKSGKNQETENKEKNKALEAAISQIDDNFGKQIRKIIINLKASFELIQEINLSNFFKNSMMIILQKTN